MRVDPLDRAAEDKIEDPIIVADAMESTGMGGMYLCMSCAVAGKGETCWLCGERYTHKRRCTWSGTGHYIQHDDPLPELVPA